MTTLPGRPNPALLVTDLQNGVVAGTHARDQVVANVATLVEKARAAGVPVVWVQHSDENVVWGSENWELVPEVSPRADESRVEKNYADAFEATNLEDVLAGLGAGRLYIAGAQTDECIRATLHSAIVRGYDAVLVSDAHTTEDHSPWGAPSPDLVIAHTNLYWTYHRAPGREAGTVTTEEADFAR